MFNMQKGRATENEGRSNPLRSTYNSTFIAVVIAVAAILALILTFWPSGGF